MSNIQNDPEVVAMRRKVQGHLDSIAKLFKNPKITLVIRSVEHEDADVVMTDDNLNDAVTSILRLKGKEDYGTNKTQNEKH